MSRRVRACVVGLALASLVSGCRQSQSSPASPVPVDERQAADTIYTGGDIVTVDRNQPEAEALAVKDGRIVAVGSRAQVEAAHKGAATQVVDLAGRTLIPAFLDAHSHYYSALGVANQANVYPPPAGPGKDPASIVAALVKFRDERKIPAGEVIQAYGYDDTAMPKGDLLNRDHLDAAFPDNPVLVQHVSMHGAVLNSAALKKWNISAATRTPPGGVIVRKPGTQEPYGLLMETAFLPIFASLPKPTAEQAVDWTKAAQQLYASHGVTTAHEGATHAGDLAVMKRAAAAGANSIDVIAYPFITDLDEVLKAYPVGTWGTYEQRLKIGGVKITIDGSPQGRTAAFTTPYLTGGPGGEKNWKGELTFPEATITQMVRRVYALGVPLNLHANGDAAIDAFLRVHEAVAGPDLTRDRHVTLIHAQFTRKDHLDKFAKYKLVPSFYTLHTYYFADAHVANRGAAAAAYISPMRDALARGLRPTNHTDFVVAPLDQLFMMWSAVNRESRGGQSIGPDQRITPLEALEAQTINVAYQYGEQDLKGSLAPGKLADLVILDRNPLKVAPAAIKDVRVVETIKEGKRIYTRR
ncbi:amidohydrolase [Luteitalea sp. TBR-22]|uniref:amidohydrolase n=1 Tax=Luteitalea sp. TBR-22 TaxID=2802971 RepID=UPI001AF9A915|nr:amidohydrolase [Luteitalea sp. TBR-22]BCS35381.1 amidohydrolase [Luteitalea sp. TBR-22]